MGYEITYPAGHTLRNSQVLEVLRGQYPNKDFSIHGNTISESYREQPDFDTMLKNSPWYRAERGAGERAVAVAMSDSADDYVGRVMSNDV